MVGEEGPGQSPWAKQAWYILELPDRIRVRQSQATAEFTRLKGQRPAGAKSRASLTAGSGYTGSHGVLLPGGACKFEGSFTGMSEHCILTSMDLDIKFHKLEWYVKNL